MTRDKQRVHFRLMHMPCCGQMLCWVNPRLPNHCPECGVSVFRQLKFGDGHLILVNDEDAWLTTVSGIG
jgi:hypothetical protein